MTEKEITPSLVMTKPNWPAATPEIRDPRHRYAEIVGLDNIADSSQFRRLQWIQQTAPDFEHGFTFFGGLTASQMFEEVQEAYIRGLYELVIIGGMSFVEQELAGVLETLGQDTDGISAYRAIKLAEENNLIPEANAQALQEARDFRNSVVHFRSGTEEDSPETYAIDTEIPIRVLEQRYARTIMIGVFLASEFWGVGRQFSTTSPPPGIQRSLSDFRPSNPANQNNNDGIQKKIKNYVPS